MLPDVCVRPLAHSLPIACAPLTAVRLPAFVAAKDDGVLPPENTATTNPRKVVLPSMEYTSTVYALPALGSYAVTTAPELPSFTRTPNGDVVPGNEPCPGMPEPNDVGHENV